MGLFNDVEELATVTQVATTSGTLVAALEFPVLYETSDDVTSSTSSTDYQQKLRLSADDVPAGKYRIGWVFEWAQSSANSEFVLRVQLNDTKDLANITTSAIPADKDKYTCSNGFCYETLSQASNYIDIDWCSSKSKKMASIRKVRIDMWRVL